MSDPLPIGRAARMIGVSVDTLRRWDKAGKITVARDAGNRRVIPVAEIERLRRPGAHPTPAHPATTPSASRLPAVSANTLNGVVRAIRSDGVMALVELDAGPYTVIAAIASADAQDLALHPGASAVALIEPLEVMIERTDDVDPGP